MWSDGEGGGYCSELCATDADCESPDAIANLRCTEETLIARPDPAHSGKTTRCRLSKTCLSCETDEDCGGEDVCMNLGGLGNLSVMRCGSPCEEEDLCSDPDHKCRTTIMPDGTESAQFACLPDVCPGDEL